MILGNVSDQVAISCHSIKGAVQANVSDTGTIISTTPTGSAIDILNTPSAGLGSYTSGGLCFIVRLAANTTGHTTGNTGVEIMTGSDGVHYTLVGMAYAGGSTNPINDNPTKRDVASWFNRRIKTCRNTWTGDATVSSSSYAELTVSSSPLHCEFVSWDRDDLGWSLFGSESGPVSQVANVSAGFDGATAQPESSQWKQNSTGLNFPLVLSGSASLSENLHYITEIAKSASGGQVTVFSGAGEEVRIPQ